MYYSTNTQIVVCEGAGHNADMAELIVASNVVLMNYRWNVAFMQLLKAIAPKWSCQLSSESSNDDNDI